MSQAQLTVIYPGTDIRGSAVNHIQAWTAAQTLPPERYKVIAVLQPGTDDEESVRQVLGPTNEVILTSDPADTAMWNAGAAKADTPWLVFVEGHSLARPDCLEALDRWLATEPEVEAGNFEIKHPENYLMARLSDRWFGEQQARWRTEWHRLHRAGFAIRREVFQELGGFERYGQFSVPLLSARFHAAGYQVGPAPGCGVTHLDDHTLYDHHQDTIDFVVGECHARSVSDPIFFEKYFGHIPAWRNHLSSSPRVVRQFVSAALKHVQQNVRKRPLATSRLFRDVFAAVLHASGEHGLTLPLMRMLTRLEEAFVLHAPIPSEVRYGWFLDAHRRVVKSGVLQWTQDHSDASKYGERAKRGRWDVAKLSPNALSGVHGLESHEGRAFRWSDRLVHIRFSPGLAVSQIRVDTGGLRPSPDRAVLLAACGPNALPPTSIRKCVESVDALVVSIPDEYLAACGEYGLTLCCRSLGPTRRIPADPRPLGLPIFSVDVS